MTSSFSDSHSHFQMSFYEMEHYFLIGCSYLYSHLANSDGFRAVKQMLVDNHSRSAFDHYKKERDCS